MTIESEKEKLTHARWVLERNLHWIAASEVKIGVVIAIDTGLFGALAAAFNGSKVVGHYYLAHVSTFFAAMLLATAIICGAMTIMPRTGGPPSSMIFFGRIAAKSKANFEHEFNQAAPADLLGDCLAQIHRNAEIAAEKFRWVIASMRWSFAAVPFWLVAIATLVKA
jgi:hypothetical protein